jgi:hypothetical protein
MTKQRIKCPKCGKWAYATYHIPVFANELYYDVETDELTFKGLSSVKDSEIKPDQLYDVRCDGCNWSLRNGLKLKYSSLMNDDFILGKYSVRGLLHAKEKV